MSVTVEESINHLLQWIDKNGWYGYDPYDLLDTKFYKFFNKYRYPRRFVEEILFNQFPLCMRRMLRVKKQIYAKAMGLFAYSFLDLYKLHEREQYLNKSLECLDWLTENCSSGYDHRCWGYPFDWQSRIFIPKDTPSGVVTSFVSDSFINAFTILGDEKYLEIAESCCQFFIADLNIDYIDRNTLCFSYTPIDTFHVHNANMLVAKQLVTVGTITKNKKFLEYAEKAMNYTLAAQNDN